MIIVINDLLKQLSISERHKCLKNKKKVDKNEKLD